MNDETLITDLIRAGVSAELVGRVVNAIADVTMSQIVRDNVPDMSRTYERERKRRYRANKLKVNAKPKANDVGKSRENVPDIVPDIVPDNSKESCNLLTSFLPIKEGIREVKKEPKSRNDALAKRGTRLSSAATLSNEDREFAFELGFDNPQIEKMWAEFVDYWSALPGQRGLKLSWTATWRNRVRQVTDRKPRGGNLPRPGSREDRQEKTYNAYQKLREYARSGPDDEGPGGDVGDPPAGLLRLAQPTRS